MNSDWRRIDDWKARAATYVAPIWSEPRSWADKITTFFYTSVESSFHNFISYEVRTDEVDGTRRQQVLVQLPHTDTKVPLEVLLFATSAVAFRLYMTICKWRERRRRRRNSRRPPPRGPPQRWSWSPPKHTRDMYRGIVKASVVNGSHYKDRGLQRTMEECQDVKRKLRKVEHPDVVRKEKQLSLKRTSWASSAQSSSSSGASCLTVSPETLQRARYFLSSRRQSSVSSTSSLDSSLSPSTSSSSTPVSPPRIDLHREFCNSAEGGGTRMAL